MPKISQSKLKTQFRELSGLSAFWETQTRHPTPKNREEAEAKLKQVDSEMRKIGALIK